MATNRSCDVGEGWVMGGAILRHGPVPEIVNKAALRLEPKRKKMQGVHVTHHT